MRSKTNNTQHSVHPVSVQHSTVHATPGREPRSMCALYARCCYFCTHSCVQTVHLIIFSPIIMLNMCIILGGHHFLWNRGVMNFRKYGNIFVTPPIWWSKILWPPFGATMLKKHVTPMRVAQKIFFFGAISLNKIFIKICSHPKISIFLWPPYFSGAAP